MSGPKTRSDSASGSNFVGPTLGDAVQPTAASHKGTRHPQNEQCLLPNPRPPIRTAQGKARCSGTLDDTPVEGARQHNMRAGTGPVAAWVPRPCQPTLQPGALRRIWLGPRNTATPSPWGVQLGQAAPGHKDDKDRQQTCHCRPAAPAVTSAPVATETPKEPAVPRSCQFVAMSTGLPHLQNPFWADPDRAQLPPTQLVYPYFG